MYWCKSDGGVVICHSWLFNWNYNAHSCINTRIRNQTKHKKNWKVSRNNIVKNRWDYQNNRDLNNNNNKNNKMKTNTVSSSNSNQLIEFDLKMSDYNRLLVVCRDVLETKSNETREFACDLFDESECHHLHSNDHHHYHHKHSNDSKCTYCKFYDLIDERSHSLK